MDPFPIRVEIVSCVISHAWFCIIPAANLSHAFFNRSDLVTLDCTAWFILSDFKTSFSNFASALDCFIACIALIHCALYFNGLVASAIVVFILASAVHALFIFDID